LDNGMMTDTDRIDWIDEPAILPKVMDYWLQTGAKSVREAIDAFAEATEKEDQRTKDWPLEF